MDKEGLFYLEFRVRYYKDKKITDLTDEEIEEFIQLRKTFKENLRNPLMNVWNQIKEAVKKAEK